MEIKQPRLKKLFKQLQITVAIIAACLFISSATASPPQSFDNETQELRFKSLVEEIRCLVCQNQNLADSDAELAQDLRAEILEMMKAGKTDEGIKKFLVDRYGEFVLYRPRMSSSTYLLWLGPAGLLLIGAIAVGLNIRKRNRQLIQDKNEPKNTD